MIYNVNWINLEYKETLYEYNFNKNIAILFWGDDKIVGDFFTIVLHFSIM